MLEPTTIHQHNTNIDHMDYYRRSGSRDYSEAFSEGQQQWPHTLFYIVNYNNTLWINYCILATIYEIYIFYDAWGKHEAL